MTKNALPVNGEAIPARSLTLNNLIDEATGETSLAVLKAMVRRRAMADYGAICPRSLRSALQYYSSILGQMQCAWRERHGLPVEYVMMAPYGRQRDGVRRSTF